MDIRTTGQFLRDVEMMVRSRERGGSAAGGHVQNSALRRLLDIARNQVATNAEKRKQIIDSTEYKLAHQVADEGAREALRIQIQREQGHFTALNVSEAQLLIEYIDFLESEVGLREPHLHISGVTQAQVGAHNASINDDAPSGIEFAHSRLSPKSRAALIERALKLADKGTRRDDGYDYIVSSKSLVEYGDTIRELCIELEATAARLPEAQTTPMNSVHKLAKWLGENAKDAFEPDVAALALKMLEWQKTTIGSYIVIVAEARQALGTGPEKNEGN